MELEIGEYVRSKEGIIDKIFSCYDTKSYLTEKIFWYTKKI